MAKDDYVPLFETRPVMGRIPFRLFAASIFVGICFICIYRFVDGTLSTAFLTKTGSPKARFNLGQNNRFEKELPGVDIFVCTADPLIEPPSLVINTVLSVMAYDYPPEKLSISLSDDGGSDLTFYAMLEAATFSKQWLPFCKKFKVEPRSPEAYFRTAFEPVNDPVKAKEWLSVKVSIE
ncbi:Cellulose synthase - like 10 [Theobroma cacao]|nr:Cellulose synthase - like 10 [Theobroma cacao]